MPVARTWRRSRPRGTGGRRGAHRVWHLHLPAQRGWQARGQCVRWAELACVGDDPGFQPDEQMRGLARRLKRTTGMGTYEPTRRIRTHRHGWLMVAAALAGPGCVLEVAPDMESDLIEETERVSQEFGPVVSCDEDETEPWPPQIPLLCFEACASDVSAEEGLQVACDFVKLTPVEGLGAAYEPRSSPDVRTCPRMTPRMYRASACRCVRGTTSTPSVTIRVRTWSLCFSGIRAALRPAGPWSWRPATRRLWSRKAAVSPHERVSILGPGPSDAQRVPAAHRVQA